MTIRFDACTAENLKREADAREFAGRIVYPALLPVVKAYDGKQANKRFIDALKKAAPGVLLIDELDFCGRLRYEVYYAGPAWYEAQQGDERPRPFFGNVPLFAIEAKGPGKGYPLDASSIIPWAEDATERAAELRGIADGTNYFINQWNEAVRALHTAARNLPGVAYEFSGINIHAVREIKPR